MGGAAQWHKSAGASFKPRPGPAPQSLCGPLAPHKRPSPINNAGTSHAPAAGNGAIEEDSGEGEDEEDEEPVLSLGAAALWLTGITVLVALCSEALTGSIEEVSHSWGLSQGFLGFIILPIAGNACEHITAVFVALKNKMDLRRALGRGRDV